MGKPAYGAQVERGVIESEADSGYIVRSLDRPGIVSPPIKAMGGQSYAASDRVYFCLFRDGTGMILCAE